MRKQISDASHLAVFEASPSFEKIMDFICYYSQVIKGVSFSQFSYPEPPKVT